MLISVIIPVYNAEKYINKCIESILSQIYSEFEVILVDDGSTDSSPQICDKYGKEDDRIKVIHKKNEGVSIARSTGVSIAKGDYLAFVDSDDWVEPDYFEKLLNIIRTTDVDMICFGHKKVVNNATSDCPFPLDESIYDRNAIENQIFPWLIEDETGRYFPNQLWNKVIKADIYKENQVSGVKIIMGEDAACVKSCIYHCKSIYVSSLLLYNYRINPMSVTVSGKKLLWDGPYLIQKHYEEHINLSECDFRQQVYRNTVHNLFNVAVSHFGHGDKYRQIKKLINKELASTCYHEAIKNVEFHNIRGKLCQYSVRYKLYFVFYLRFKLRNLHRGG